MLPSAPQSARSITGVASDILASVSGRAAALASVRSAVLVVIDGLGALQLRAHAGHARRLTADMAKKDVAHSVFPSTTATALTSLLTAVDPGSHGLVGYSVLDRAGDRLVNQLSGWESSGLDPLEWQSAPTVFETARRAGHPTFAVGLPAYATSGFTQATLRGADFVVGHSPRERVHKALQLAAENDGAIVYCYLPEADKAGHKHGVDSPAWVRALEEIDAAFAEPVPPGVGVLITADHGMVDVPAHRHLVFGTDDHMLDGIRHVGGEPRMLHVYLEPDASHEQVLETWRRATDGAADVLSRQEAISAGLFGAIASDAVARRVGDLVVPARGLWALYDGVNGDRRAQSMIGQHGSLTPEERLVPYLRFGAYAGR